MRLARPPCEPWSSTDLPPTPVRAASLRSPSPEPGRGEVAIDVDCAGVNFIDVMARRGDPGYAAVWPFVPGLEAASKVRSLGPGVDGLAIGERVAAFTGAGGLADVALARADLVAGVPAACHGGPTGPDRGPRARQAGGTDTRNLKEFDSFDFMIDALASPRVAVAAGPGGRSGIKPLGDQEEGVRRLGGTCN